MKKIIAVHGGRPLSDLDYGRVLLLALDLAREKLGCSFLGMDGRDIARRYSRQVCGEKSRIRT